MRVQRRALLEEFRQRFGASWRAHTFASARRSREKTRDARRHVLRGIDNRIRHVRDAGARRRYRRNQDRACPRIRSYSLEQRSNALIPLRKV
jgi:hypothetical protein